MDQKKEGTNDAQKGMRLLSTPQSGSPFSDWMDCVYDESNIRWRKLADQGDAEFCWLLGAAYGHSHAPYKFEAKQNGKSFEPPWLEDSIEAQKPWFRRAAELGHPVSQFQLGDLIADSDPFEAFEWKLRAAENGLTDAMISVAACYKKGDPVPTDYAQAHHWLTLAAKAGDQKATAYLLVYKYEGIGPSHDPNAAECELIVLANKGDETAKSILWTWKNRRERGLM